ncbi:hypothetical protein FAF44_37605 [Nonomuraea sp. MG754425]|uniref:hypothetical protein n=1 Tax=Nonomuraea sp. MG754425 TaxID=2570319 RepID=UPI001F37650E|nr:hypothetical protein [Nonomuraea sp. MG754425]MCF6474060.1 hypothetical protein [Nonomuraea sp. MG754425]
MERLLPGPGLGSAAQGDAGCVTGGRAREQLDQDAERGILMAGKIRLYRWEETYVVASDVNNQKLRKAVVEELVMDRALSHDKDPTYATEATGKKVEFPLDKSLVLDDIVKVGLDLETGLGYRLLSDKKVYEVALGKNGDARAEKLDDAKYGCCTWAIDPSASGGLLYCGHANEGKITSFGAPKNGSRKQAQKVDVPVATDWTSGVEDVRVYAAADGRRAYALSGVVGGKRKFGLVDLTKSDSDSGIDVVGRDKVFGTVDVSESVSRIVISSDDRYALVADRMCIQRILLEKNLVTTISQNEAVLSWPAIVAVDGKTYCVYAVQESHKIAFKIVDLSNPEMPATYGTPVTNAAEKPPLQPLFHEPGTKKVWGFLRTDKHAAVIAFEVSVPSGSITFGRLGTEVEEAESSLSRQTFFVTSW